MKLSDYQRLLSSCFANQKPGACKKLVTEAEQQQGKVRQVKHATYQSQMFKCFGEKNKPACENLEKAFAVCVAAAVFQPN